MQCCFVFLGTIMVMCTVYFTLLLLLLQYCLCVVECAESCVGAYFLLKYNGFVLFQLRH